MIIHLKSTAVAYRVPIGDYNYLQCSYTCNLHVIIDSVHKPDDLKLLQVSLCHFILFFFPKVKLGTAQNLFGALVWS